MLNLTCTFNLITKICNFFLAAANFKSLLLKMVATVMTVEFGTILHYSSLVEKFWSLFVQFFEQVQTLTEHYVDYDILV